MKTEEKRNRYELVKIFKILFHISNGWVCFHWMKEKHEWIFNYDWKETEKNAHILCIHLMSSKNDSNARGKSNHSKRNFPARETNSNKLFSWKLSMATANDQMKTEQQIQCHSLHIVHLNQSNFDNPFKISQYHGYFFALKYSCYTIHICINRSNETIKRTWLVLWVHFILLYEMKLTIIRCHGTKREKQLNKWAHD